MDEGLEHQRRYLQANPDDPDAWPRTVHAALRADKLDIARGLIDELVDRLDQACASHIFARQTRTPLEPLTDRAPRLDLAAAVLARAGEDGLPFFAAAEASADNRYAEFALRTLLENTPQRCLDRPARLASAALRRDEATRRFAHDALAPLAAELPLSARLALACIAREQAIEDSPMLQDPRRGIRALAAVEPDADPAIPRPIAPLDPPEIESQPGRGFGAHGPDYSFGPFLGLRTRLEHRMVLFDFAFLEELRLEIGRITERFHIPAPVSVAFSEGYGFAWDDDHQPEEKSIEALMRVLNAQKIYPGELRFGGRRPFDPLDDDDALAQRFYRDFHFHPANRRLFWSSPVMRVIYAVGSTPKDQAIPDCQDELARAAELYTKPAARALERFYQTVIELRRRARGRLPFHED